MNNEYDFIKEKFDNDGIVTPDRLSEDNIIGMLKDKPKLKIYKRKSFKAFVSAVACLVLAVGVFASAMPRQSNILAPENNKNVDVSGITSFDSYDEIRALVKKNINQGKLSGVIKGGFGFNMTKDEAAESAATYDAYSDSFGQTYIQVDGVDEGDILKNDGKYMYYVADLGEIKIYEGEKLVSTIDDFSYTNYNVYGSGLRRDILVDDLYVNNNKLIVNASTSVYKGDDEDYFTMSSIYDITDITAPKLIESFKQTGTYQASRMIGNILYVISNVYMYDVTTADSCYICTGKGEKEDVVSPSSIYHCGSTPNNNYAVISAINTDECERTANTKAFYGCTSDIYCSQDNLYLTVYNDGKTQIVRTKLDANEIKFNAKAEVDGFVYGQFSMDEKDGYFRIATSDDKANNLYVLDSNLKQVGKVTGFAEDEEIQAVKYIGDIAYVITYEYIDPLFVIDLSDPVNPVIKGSVEITGFSSQLVPVDENTLLGIGQDDSGCDLKLALFDISDPCKPTVLDSIELDDTDSNAKYNHRAILVNREQNYFAFDFTDWYSEYGNTGAVVVTIENNKINIQKHNVERTDEYRFASRVTYIGNTIYVFDYTGDIYAIND